jgi:glycerol-3-phosphate O-acyltransferase / dihydroxyacetone phosphate acyltransferase
MALSELAAKPDSPISLVPCGLNYTHRGKFRSRVLVEYGPPIEIPKRLVNLYQAGQRSEAVRELLQEIKQCLVSVTLTATDEETLTVRVLASV